MNEHLTVPADSAESLSEPAGQHIPGENGAAPLPNAPYPMGQVERADKIVRYCPECGLIGAVQPQFIACCPDACGMSVRRWQAEKLERIFAELRATITKATGSKQ